MWRTRFESVDPGLSSTGFLVAKACKERESWAPGGVDQERSRAGTLYGRARVVDQEWIRNRAAWDNRGMARFTVVIEQDEDGVFCASCPALPGCFSHGATYDEAVSNMREAMSLHVGVLVEHGDPIPQPRSVGTEDIDVAV